MARKTIGFFMSILENDFSAALLDGAAKASENLDVNLVVFPMDIINATYLSPDMTACRYQYNVLSSYMDTEGIDGIMVDFASITQFLSKEKKEDFIRLFGNKPVMLLSESMDGYASATVDNRAGLTEIIDHLVECHHDTKIAFMSGPENNADSISRLGIYKDAIRKHNLKLDDSWIEYGNFTSMISGQAERLMEKHPDAEAIVCANDAMALGVVDVIKKHGLVPGKDIHVTGFDDVAAGFLCDPAITTVSADPAELAYRAMESLVGNPEGPENVIIPTRMVIRESCGCSEAAIEEKWEKALELSPDWREVARHRLEADQERKIFEYELANIARELISAKESGKDRYGAILDSLKRLQFTYGALFLYDNPIVHNSDEKWVRPDKINLVGYYSQSERYENRLWENGECPCDNNALFYNVPKEGKHLSIVVPLFFVKNQMGLLIVESDHKKFVSANFYAGQISNTLYIILLNEQQNVIARQLKEASEAKSRFLANMSHEIRTPINSIIGFNEMILRESGDETINEYATDVKNAAEALLLLINDVLDFSRIEAGKVEIIPVEYDLYKFIDNCLGMVTSRAEAKGLSMFKNIDRSLPHILYGDSGRIQQILINLISNAIKYTEKGTVTLSVSGKVSKDKVMLSFAVKDTGIGIKDEDIERIYNAFDRLEEKRNKNVEGTGLGLNITTNLLELMGSKLKVTSKYGVGSEFSFDIEQRIIRSAGEDSDVQVNKYEKLKFRAPLAKTLVVDDNKVNLKLVKSLLKQTEIQVELAESGARCIEMLKEGSYDIILMDHMMPEMDGIETFNRIREEGLIDTSKCTVIALTANAISGAREEYLKNGFADYLSKPIKPEELDKLLLKYIPDEYVIYEQS